MLASRPFRLRRFVTFVLLITFAVAGVSGILLFARPEGSVARWVGWSALGLDKKQWESVHITFVAVFLLASLVHIAYNWRPLMAYLRRNASAPRSLARLVPSLELTAAVVAAVAVAYGTLAGREPFSSLLHLRADVKDGWFVTTTPPPMADADRLTVAEVCRRVAASEQEVVSDARRQGVIITDTSATLASVARRHGMSPERVYEVICGAAEGRGQARP